MKKTAVLVFEGFCNYEISALLEMLVLNEKPVTFVANRLSMIRCEEGMQVMPDCTLNDMVLEDYDSLVISGSFAEGLYYNFKDEKLMEVIEQFEKQGKLIAAISSAPMILCKANIMRDRKFQAGVDKSWFLEDMNMLLHEEQMKYLIDVPEMKKMRENGNSVDDFMMENKVLTAYGWKYREWAAAFIEYFELNPYRTSFGLDEK
ncbi:MAG: DJ-1/PfpI family protein [Anaerorhabdus sp.]|uniref:DJ-1/PfpI family protein n=1 Tax=Anaerorhabdus sp. TaxID=1872524 RepID=UPI003A88B291